MNELWTGVVTIALAIVGVAVLAVIVSRNANTAQVIQSAGGAFSGALGAAEGPVMGSQTNIFGQTTYSGGANPVTVY